MFVSRLALAACGLLAMICAGCGGSGPKLHPVSGTVNYDGKPLADASILFVPQGGRPSMGTTDESGKFTLTTGGKPGAPVGTYSVTVTKANSGDAEAAEVKLPSSDAQLSEEEIKKVQEQMQEQMRGMNNHPRPKPTIPAKYSLPEGSGLSAIVTADAATNVFTFELTP